MLRPKGWLSGVCQETGVSEARFPSRTNAGRTILIDMPNATRLMDAAAAGDNQAAADLLPLVYGELRKLASARLAAEKPGQTLQATALVHEVFLRLVGSDPAKPWAGRGQFFAAAAEAWMPKT